MGFVDYLRDYSDYPICWPCSFEMFVAKRPIELLFQDGGVSTKCHPLENTYESGILY